MLDFLEWGPWILRCGTMGQKVLDMAIETYFQITPPYGVEGLRLHSAGVYRAFPMPTSVLGSNHAAASSAPMSRI